MAVDGVHALERNLGDDPAEVARSMFDAIVAVVRLQQTEESRGSGAGGYRVAGDYEVWPPVSGTRIETAPASEGSNALMYVTESGERVVVKADVNPGLYGYMTELKALGETPGATDWIEEQIGETDAHILRGDEMPPPIGDVSTIVMANNDRAVLEMKDGTRVVVSAQLSPEAFRQVDDMFQTFEGVSQSIDAGYELVTDGDYTDKQIEAAAIGADGEVGPGVIRAEIDGRKIVVREDQDPDLYGRLAGAHEAQTDHGEAIDAARVEAELPPARDFDVVEMETSEVDPPDAKDPNKKLTVGELTWKNLVADWKTGIENGSIGPDDDRAKLYNALRAKGMIENGTDMVNLDIQTGLNTTPVTGGDMEHVIDEAAVDTQISTLLGSDRVQADFQKKQAEAVDKISNKDEVKSRLEEMAFGKDYVQYIADLQAAGKGDVAEADIGQTYAALAAFDPQKAADFSQSMLVHGLTIDLDDLMRNPEGISEENTALATQDTIKTLLSAFKNGGVNLPRRTVESLDKFVNEFLGDKQTAKAFGDALRELGDTFGRNGLVTQADIDKVFNKDIYKSLGEGARSSMLTAVAEINGNGLLGSVGGLISLASGIYQIAGKGGSLADTPEERLAIAKEFVSVLGAGQHFVSFGSTLIDSYNRNTKYGDMLGLGKSLPETFGKDKPTGRGPLTPETFERIADNFQKLVDDAPTAGRDQVRQRLDLQGKNYENFIKGYEDGFAKNPGLKGSTPGTRALTSFLRVMDAGANVFAGVADTVLGGLKIKGSIASGDMVGVAQGAITVAAGAFTAGGGASQAFALGTNSSSRVLASVAGVARALSGPLLWIGAALQVALTPFLIIDDIKRTRQIEGFEDDQKKFFADIDAQGLLRDDGAERYAFLGTYMRNYGQRDAPEDRSIFDYRSREYDFFVAEGHLPEPGWDHVDHEDYEGDGANLATQMDDNWTS